MLVVDVNAEILLEYLVDALRLAIGFWVVGGGEVRLDA